MTAEQQPRYAMTSESRKRLAESQAELLAAAEPHAWPESAELVELRATVARCEALVGSLDLAAVALTDPTEEPATRARGVSLAYCADRLRLALAGGAA